MHIDRVITEQQSAVPAPPAPPAVGRTGVPSSNDIREQVRQTILDAQEAARDAQQGARDAQAQARDAANAGRLAHTLPGGVVVRTGGGNEIPSQAVDISIAFFLMCAVIVIGWPIARAFGKRMERGATSTAMSPVMSEQLQRIEQAVDAMSIEVERISESQRFLAKLQGGPATERAALPLGERR